MNHKLTDEQHMMLTDAMSKASDHIIEAVTRLQDEHRQQELTQFESNIIGAITILSWPRTDGINDVTENGKICGAVAIETAGDFAKLVISLLASAMNKDSNMLGDVFDPFQCPCIKCQLLVRAIDIMKAVINLEAAQTNMIMGKKIDQEEVDAVAKKLLGDG